MRPSRSRGSAAATDGDDVHSDADNNGRRRQPFRPLQPQQSCSPKTITALSNLPTPPREIILTPRATPKPIKRKASARLARAATKVKSEPPEIDLSRVRPPSPSDDPLLLSGPRSARSPPLRARLTPVFSSSSPGSTHIDSPPVSFATRLSGVGTRHGASSSPNTDVHALPVFNALRAVEEAGEVWSDSDDDGFNLTGEYTGKYKILKVPTKMGPPMREHTDSWGRPVSPFPFSEIMERSLPLSDMAEEGGWRDPMPCDDTTVCEVATEPPPSDVELSPPPSVSEDEFADLDCEFPLFDVDAESTQVLPRVESRESCLDSDQITMEEQEEEEQIDRELSVAVDDGPNDPPTFTLSKADQLVSPMEGDTEDEDEDVAGEDIIKITSEDPKAAARAAAILRMHDYDCILAAEKKKRSGRFTTSTRKRRKTIENAGISKSYTDLRSQRWQTLRGSDTSPGSRSLPLLDLWQDTEDSVFLEHHSKGLCDTSFTLSPLKPMTIPPEPLLPPPTGEWTRDCWKRLDKCLVAERLAVAVAYGLGTHVFADMGKVSKDAVLDRFANQLGGESVLVGLGPDWTRDNLILRLDVLIKKQSQRARSSSLDATESRYRGLLREAVALSKTTERDSASMSDTTVVSDGHSAPKNKMLSLLYGWQPHDRRSPIRTPSHTPDRDLRWPHPKDQVHLRHTSPLPKSMIPVPVRPKRLVDLRHCSPTKGDADRGGWRLEARRSSGSSVRELVKQYEGLDK